MIENGDMIVVFKKWDGPSGEYIIDPNRPQQSLNQPVTFGGVTLHMGQPGHADLAPRTGKGILLKRTQELFEEMTLVLQRQPQPGQSASVGDLEKHRLGVDNLRETTSQLAIQDLQFVTMLQIYHGVPSKDLHPPMVEIVSSSLIGEGSGPMLH